MPQDRAGDTTMTTNLTLGEEHLDIAEVSILLKTSPSALYTQRHRGEPPGSLAVRVGKKLLWRRSDLDSWWEAQRDQSPRAESLE